MAFLEDISGIFGSDFTFGKDFLCTLSQNAGYFEKVIGIVKYTDSEIVLQVKRGLITVSGKELSVKKYCEGDVAICGNITCVKKD